MIALCAGHEPGHRPAPRGERHVAEVRHRAGGEPAGDGQGGLRAARPAQLGLAKLGKLAKFCKFLAGSFSAVSKRNFARKYAFDSIFQALQDLHTFAPLQSQMFSKKSV